MSLPSIPAIMQEKGISSIRSAAPAVVDAVLLEAMRRDVPLAVNYLDDMVREIGATKQPFVMRIEDPGSPLGKQLTRVFASTAMRRLATEHILGGNECAFVNCCSPILARPGSMPSEFEIACLQVEAQNGVLAHADC